MKKDQKVTQAKKELIGNKKFAVSKATMRRYPIYLKALRKLKEQGYSRILSQELSEVTDILATTIRRDFSFIGSLGRQGYGYDIDKMISVFDEILGVNYEEEIIIIGVGNLGRALLNYNRWDQVVGRIVCGFDKDPQKIQTLQIANEDFPIYDIKDLKEKVPKNCHLAIITANQDPQDIVDQLVAVGITGIVDFSHEHVQVPKHVILKKVDIVSALQEVIFQTNNLE